MFLRKLATKCCFFPTSSNYCFHPTWQDKTIQKLHFSLKCCIAALQKHTEKHTEIVTSSHLNHPSWVEQFTVCTKQEA